MTLLEIFKSDQEYKLLRTRPGFLYSFTTPDTSIDVEITPYQWPQSEEVASFYVDRVRNHKEPHESLVRKHGGCYSVRFSPAGSKYHGATHLNKGTFGVINGVIKIIEDFVAEHHAIEIAFTANKKEPSRVKLYNKLVQTIPSRMYFALVSQKDTGGEISYVLARNDIL